MKTQDILYLALRKGETTSEDVVKELVGEVNNRGDYRGLLAQASTLLRRLHKRGMLERKWVKDHGGQYVYSPSDKVISSLVPALNVLEEKKMAKETEETLTEFAKEIILNLRMEEKIKAILWDLSKERESKEGIGAKVWIVMADMENRSIIERKIKEGKGTVKIDPVFVTPNDLIPLQSVDSMKILYGWNFIASIK